MICCPDLLTPSGFLIAISRTHMHKHLQDETVILHGFNTIVLEGEVIK